MTLRNDRQLANTKQKLADIERLLKEAKEGPGPGAGAEVRSLGRLAAQLKEEITLYEAASEPSPHH